MTLSAPRYVISERHTRSERYRVLAIVVENVRLRATLGPLLLAAFGFMATFLPLLLPILFGYVLNYTPQLQPSNFYPAFSDEFLFLFVMMMTAFVGAGLVADDLRTRSITLYLSRPITVLDYILGKGATLGTYLAILCIVPGVLTVIVVSALGYVTASAAVQTLVAFVGVGLLMVVFFAGLGLLLSCLTERRAFAGVGIFALILLDRLLAAGLSGGTQNTGWLYVSPWDDLEAVAQQAFSVSPLSTPLNPAVALAVLLGLGALAYLLVYLRLSRLQVVTD